MTPLLDCCYTCQTCSRVVCTDNESSAGAPTWCGDCWADHARELDHEIETALRAGWGS